MQHTVIRRSRLRFIARIALLALATLGNSACISLLMKEAGGIQVTSNVPAAILVDGREVGMTPMRIYPKPRDVRRPINITVLADGYAPVTERVTVGTDHWFSAKAHLPYFAGIVGLLAAGISTDEFGDTEFGASAYAAVGLYGLYLVDLFIGKAAEKGRSYSHPVIRADLVPDPD